MEQSVTLNGSELLQVGSVVSDCYVVSGCLGVGSTSSVYTCYHQNSPESTLVLKVLHKSVTSDEVTCERFQKEIIAAQHVRHPNVIQCFQSVRTDELTGYFMEYAENGALKQLLGEQLSIQRVRSMLIQLCRGLAAIHEQGIVHRDLKPGNILLTSDGTIKIADFGIARIEKGKPLTQHGDVIGAIDYASPEYIESGNLDQRSDIYAIGLLAYELATSTFPFGKGDNPIQTLMKRLTEDPQAPLMLRAEIGEELSNWILRALKRNPDERFQSAREMLAAIDPEYVEEAVALEEQSEVEAAQESTEAPLPKEEEVALPNIITRAEFEIPAQASRSKKPQLIFATAMLVVAVGLALLLFQDGETSSAPIASEPEVAQETAPAVEVAVEQAAPAVAALGPTIERQPLTAEAQPETTLPQTPVVVFTNNPSELEASELEAAPAEKDSPTFEATPEQEIRVEYTPPSTQADTRFYTVVEGDTIFEIAEEYGVSPVRLMQINNVLQPRKLPVGQKLEIPN